MTACYHCGEEFRWIWRDDGIKPVNISDDRYHWQTCAKFRRPPKRKAKAGEPLTRYTGTTKGDLYRPSCGQCTALPWEEEGCACSFNFDAAKTVLAKLRSGKLPIEFTARDVYRPGWSGLTTAEEAQAAIRVLIDFKHIREKPLEQHETGRPSRVYQAHPSTKGDA